MKAEDIVIGMTVLSYGELDYKLTVEALPDEQGKVLLKDSRGHLESYSLSNIEPYDPQDVEKVGKEVQAKLDEAKNAFEQAFTAYKEAEEIANKKYSIYQLQEVDACSMKELENTIESHGWSVSSFRC